MICDWWISIRFDCFCVSRFVACDVLMIDGSEKRNCELQSSRVFEKRS